MSAYTTGGLASSVTLPARFPHPLNLPEDRYESPAEEIENAKTVRLVSFLRLLYDVYLHPMNAVGGTRDDEAVMGHP